MHLPHSRPAGRRELVVLARPGAFALHPVGVQQILPLEASQQRVQDAMEPFIRHVRSEIERLRGQAYELGARRKDVEALRGQIAAMR